MKFFMYLGFVFLFCTLALEIADADAVTTNKAKHRIKALKS